MFFANIDPKFAKKGKFMRSDNTSMSKWIRNKHSLYAAETLKFTIQFRRTKNPTKRKHIKCQL